MGYRLKKVNRAVHGIINQAALFGFEIVPIIWAAAEPANQVTTAAFEHIMGLIENGLTNTGPVDGVYLDLHGAMVFEKYHTGEIKILKRMPQNLFLTCSAQLKQSKKRPDSQRSDSPANSGGCTG